MAQVDEGIEYAQAVAGGQIVACDLLKKSRAFSIGCRACRPGFKPDAAQHILDFYGFLPHVKGI